MTDLRPAQTLQLGAHVQVNGDYSEETRLRLGEGIVERVTQLMSSDRSVGLPVRVHVQFHGGRAEEVAREAEDAQDEADRADFDRVVAKTAEMSSTEQLARDNVTLYRQVIELEEQNRQRLRRIAQLKIQLEAATRAKSKLEKSVPGAE